MPACRQAGPAKDLGSLLRFGGEFSFEDYRQEHLDQMRGESPGTVRPFWHSKDLEAFVQLIVIFPTAE